MYVYRLKNNEPHVWEKVRHVLLPHDYLNYWLTGEFAMEVCVPVVANFVSFCRVSSGVV